MSPRRRFLPDTFFDIDLRPLPVWKVIRKIFLKIGRTLSRESDLNGFYR